MVFANARRYQTNDFGVEGKPSEKRVRDDLCVFPFL
jgi:hypothetical protein